MRTTDRVFGYAILTVLPGKTLEKCAVFLFFRERVWEKRRRRFALSAQSKKGLVECGGKRSATPLFFGEHIWGSILVSLGVFSGPSLSRLLLVGLRDFAKRMAAMPHHVSIAHEALAPFLCF